MDNTMVQKFIDKLQAVNNDMSAKLIYAEVQIETIQEQAKVIQEALAEKEKEVALLNTQVADLKDQLNAFNKQEEATSDPQLLCEEDRAAE